MSKSGRWKRFKEELLPIILLFILAFTIRFVGGAWETRWDNDAYIARQAEYIYSFGHLAVPDPFSSAPLYQPGMAYLLALVGWLIDLIPLQIHTVQYGYRGGGGATIARSRHRAAHILVCKKPVQ